MNGASALLPRAPAAVLGIIIHRLLEESARGFVLKDEVETRWDALIAETEANLRNSWLNRHFVPLNICVSMFDVKRIRTLARAREVASATRISFEQRGNVGRGIIATGYEVPLSTPDGAVKGIADAIINEKGGVTIRDYKSGQIFEEVDGQRTIHNTFVDQLCIYSAIYFESYGTWPNRLEVVPLAGQPFLITVDHDKCQTTLNEARAMLSSVNKIIDNSATSKDVEALLARPNPNTCNRCQFRPGCAPYWHARNNDKGLEPWPQDIIGVFMSGTSLRNNLVGLDISIATGTARLRGFEDNQQRHPALVDLERGSRVAVYAMGRTADALSWVERGRTTIYILGD